MRRQGRRPAVHQLASFSLDERRRAQLAVGVRREKAALQRAAAAVCSGMLHTVRRERLRGCLPMVLTASSGRGSLPQALAPPLDVARDRSM